jgi:hypothetical protein
MIFARLVANLIKKKQLVSSIVTQILAEMCETERNFAEHLF